jgi:hypothetical protein
MEIRSHLFGNTVIAIYMFADVLHTPLEVGPAVGGILGDKGDMIAEPTDDLGRESVLQMASVVLNPPCFVIAAEENIAVLENAKFAP